MRHGDVGDPLLHLRVGRDPYEELKLAVGGGEPEVGDQDGEHDGAHGVNPPFQFAAAHGGEQTEAVDEEIVAVIFPEDADLRVDITEGPAVGEQGQFCSSGDGNRYHGGKMESFGFGAVAAFEFHEGKDDDDPRDGGHEEAEDNVAGGFDASFPRGKATGIDVSDRTIANDEGDVGQRVEDGVRHGGEEGERTSGGDGSVCLENGEEQIGGERTFYRYLVFQVVFTFEDFGLSNVFVHWLQPFFNILVLVLVEILQLLGLVGFFAEGDGTVAVSLPGRVRTEMFDFTFGLLSPREIVGIVLTGVLGRLILDVRGSIGGMARYWIILCA